MILHDDLDVAIRDWLEAGSHELPEPYLEMALDEIESTSQRGWTWPILGWPRLAGFAPLGALVVIIGLVLAGGWAVGAGRPPVRSAAVGSLAPTQSPRVPPEGFEHRTTDRFRIPLAYDAPISSTSTDISDDFHDISVDYGTYGLGVMTDVHLYADPCHWRNGFAELPPNATPGDLANVVHNLPGYSSILPESVTVDGRAAVRVDFRYTGSTECDIATTTRVAMVGRDQYVDLCTCGAQQRWVILDVGGRRIVIEEWSMGVGLVYRLPELDQILESLRFE